jgi:hypothetical protein
MAHTYPLTLGRGLSRYRHRSRSAKRAGKENPALTKEQTAIGGLLAALGWEHPRERDADPVL